QLALAATPTILPGVTANRRFLGRAVLCMAEEGGVRQFIDVGTGISSANNTHEVAQAIDPDARVLLTGKPGTTAYIDADARDPGRILTEAARTPDISKPVGSCSSPSCTASS
ncbi:MAG: SAM-dependent methyltransferase, partial [Streptosporangiaceae bacterium]